MVSLCVFENSYTIRYSLIVRIFYNGGVIVKFLQWLLGWHRKVDRAITTSHYQRFRRELIAQNRFNDISEVEEDIQCRYVVLKRMSPFVNDWDLKEARKLLKENGIRQKIP